MSRLEVGDPCPGGGRPSVPGHVDDALGFVCSVCGRTEAGKTARKHKLGAFELADLRAAALARARPLRAARKHIDLALAYLDDDLLVGDGNLRYGAFGIRGKASYIDRALDALDPYLEEPER